MAAGNTSERAHFPPLLRCASPAEAPSPGCSSRVGSSSETWCFPAHTALPPWHHLPAVWVLQALGLEFTMDVGYYGGRGVYEPLMAAFEQTYNGNRAPLPIFLHTTWQVWDMRGAVPTTWCRRVPIESVGDAATHAWHCCHSAWALACCCPDCNTCLCAGLRRILTA